MTLIIPSKKAGVYKMHLKHFFHRTDKVIKPTKVNQF